MIERKNNIETYQAALVIIGNEILAGRTQDTNTQWIAENLVRYGVMLTEVRVVPDEEHMIIGAVNTLRSKYQYVFTTGGIGPTHDDITASSIAKAFDVDLIKHPEAYAVLEEHYSEKNFTDARKKMAYVPEGAKLIPNPVSSAPGFIIENVYVMAGVPRIMQGMFDYILETIEAGAPILSYTVTCDLKESVVAERLEALQKEYDGIQIGSYPHYRGGDFSLSLVVRGTDKAIIDEVSDKLLSLIRDLGGSPQALSVS